MSDLLPNTDLTVPLAVLLEEVACVAQRDADAIRDSYRWPPRPPLTNEERREVDRLDALSRRLFYRARAVEAGLPWPEEPMRGKVTGLR